ncbi:MAG: phosphodiester glycosidase family protein [Myxococcota bacterium]
MSLCYTLALMRVFVAALVLLSASGTGKARAQCAPVDLGLPSVVAESCLVEDRAYVVVQVELRSPDIGLHVSPPTARGALPDRWVTELPGAVLAVQAGPFDFVDQRPLGLTVGEGAPWTETRDDGSRAVLAFDERNAGLFVPPEQVVSVEPWMYSVLSGVPVLREGRVLPCEGTGCAPAPRSGIGLSEDGGTLVLASARGYGASYPGITDQDLAALLLEGGAASGIQTGAGATSVMVRPGEALVPSSETNTRRTAAFLSLVDRRTGGTGNLIGKVLDEASADLPNASVRIETLDGQVFMRGTTGGAALFQFDLPPRQYIVWAESAGLIPGCRICDVAAGTMRWCSITLRGTGAEEECVPERFGVAAGPWPEAPVEMTAPPTVPLEANGCSVGASHENLAYGSVIVLLFALRRLGRRRR